jgi:nucleotide-binding universal stress UspA family protein
MLEKSEGNPTPEVAIDQAAELTRLMGGHLTALLFRLDRSRIARMHPTAEWLFDVPHLVDESIQKSASDARRLLEHFENVTTAAGILKQHLLEGSPVYPTPDPIIDHARLHDLTFLPVVEPLGFDELYTEAVIFGSGRPTILLPAFSDKKPVTPSMDIVALAWDSSRAASRVLADAMPILQKAKRVVVFTVTNEKPVPDKDANDRLDQHLHLHGINAGFERIDAAGRSIGKVIETFVKTNHVSLLVMGAFGHPRIMEFVLGGATRSIVNRPPVPVLLSH